jgi:hypothetical protein
MGANQAETNWFFSLYGSYLVLDGLP